MEVWTEITCGWVKPVCSTGADSSLFSPNVPGTPELWMAARCHLGRLLIHQEGEKGRSKLRQEFPVKSTQASQLDRPVAKLIGDATVPGTQPA